MSQCDSIDLIGYLAGNDPDGCVAGHLAQCSGCRQEAARYHKLIQALQPQSCRHRQATVDSALADAGAADQEHIKKCLECRLIFAAVCHSCADIDKKVAALDLRLPATLQAMAAQRKKEYLAGRMRKVLHLQGIIAKKEQDKKITHLFAQADDALPKAAFPDDLTGKKKDGDDEV